VGGDRRRAGGRAGRDPADRTAPRALAAAHERVGGRGLAGAGVGGGIPPAAARAAAALPLPADAAGAQGRPGHVQRRLCRGPDRRFAHRLRRAGMEAAVGRRARRSDRLDQRRPRSRRRAGPAAQRGPAADPGVGPRPAPAQRLRRADPAPAHAGPPVRPGLRPERAPRQPHRPRAHAALGPRAAAGEDRRPAVGVGEGGAGAGGEAAADRAGRPLRRRQRLGDPRPAAVRAAGHRQDHDRAHLRREHAVRVLPAVAVGPEVRLHRPERTSRRCGRRRAPNRARSCSSTNARACSAVAAG